ncbi:hypothetical protein V1478_017692 [Vespula squamosa]|uniref:Uncharacterized protein n=1 Tax=Vespula squamosa TaxID=30214 RepID=A0ABD1ZX14_VESSQ
MSTFIKLSKAFEYKKFRRECLMREDLCVHKNDYKFIRTKINCIVANNCVYCLLSQLIQFIIKLYNFQKSVAVKQKSTLYFH